MLDTTLEGIIDAVLRGFTLGKKKEVKQYKPTPYPIKAKNVVTDIETVSGQKVRIYSQEKVVVERYDYTKNPNLKEVVRINHSIIYQFIDSGDFVQFTFDPSGEQQPIWNKLDNHDIDSLLAFCVAHQRGFHNPPSYPQIWLRKNVMRKLKKILGLKIHEVSS